MAESGHIDVDGLAALVLGGLEGEDLQRAEAHLATGCARCARDRAWVERVVGLARSDRSVDPPPHVLARAKRIGASQSAQALPDGAPRRRIRALSLFDSMGTAVPMGIRGPEGSSRHVLYGAADVPIEIAMQVQHATGRVGILELRGQVFSLADDPGAVTGLRVVLTAPRVHRETVTSPLGEFQMEAPEDAELLVLHMREYEIEVPVTTP